MNSTASMLAALEMIYRSSFHPVDCGEGKIVFDTPATIR